MSCWLKHVKSSFFCDQRIPIFHDPRSVGDTLCLRTGTANQSCPRTASKSHRWPDGVGTVPTKRWVFHGFPVFQRPSLPPANAGLLMFTVSHKRVVVCWSFGIKPRNKDCGIFRGMSSTKQWGWIERLKCSSLWYSNRLMGISWRWGL